MPKVPSEVGVEIAARAVHEANRAYCLSVGDTSQVAWEDVTEAIKEVVRNGVRGILSGDTAATSHERWADKMRADGWVYGGIKDPVAKTHPCIVPYAVLPEAQQLKDHLFGAVARAVGEVLDLPRRPALPQ